MQRVETNRAPAAIGPYSQAIVSGNMIFTSGQIALKPDGTLVEGDVAEQTHQVLRNLQQVLEAAGSGLEEVVKTTIYLADMEDFTRVNAIYGEYFDGILPARSTVAVKTLPKNVAVEIDAIAVKEHEGYDY